MRNGIWDKSLTDYLTGFFVQILFAENIKCVILIMERVRIKESCTCAETGGRIGEESIDCCGYAE
jgi:hypothetical protein